MYLDAAYFGHGAWGVEKASRVYFGVAPDQLSWGQASLLAGLVNAPTAYDPTAHLTLARSGSVTCSTGWSRPTSSPGRRRPPSSPNRFIRRCRSPGERPRGRRCKDHRHAFAHDPAGFRGFLVRI